MEKPRFSEKRRKLQRDRTPQIDIGRLVGHTHCPTTQLDWSAIRIQHHFIVLKSASLRRILPSLQGCWLGQILDPVLESRQIPRRKLRGGYRLGRTPYRRWRRTSCRRPGRCVLPAGLIPPLCRVPAQALRILYSRLQPSFGGD